MCYFWSSIGLIHPRKRWKARFFVFLEFPYLNFSAYIIENNRKKNSLFWRFCPQTCKNIDFEKKWQKSEKWILFFVSRLTDAIFLKKIVFGPFCPQNCKKRVQKIKNHVLWPIKIVKKWPFLRLCSFTCRKNRKKTLFCTSIL